jgi:purine nucleoside permease
VRSGFGFSGRRLSHSLLGGETVVNRQRCGQTAELRVAKKTRQRFVSRVTKLYEQDSISEVIEGYVRRWKQWATGGLGEYAKQRARM